MAQRLVRRLCPDCRQAYRPTEEELTEVGLSYADVEAKSGGAIFKPGDDPECETCLGLGYKGRMGIYEILGIGDDIRKLVMNRADTSEIKKEAARQGMRNLREDGALKVLDGHTSIEEVLRVTQEDMA